MPVRTFLALTATALTLAVGAAPASATPGTDADVPVLTTTGTDGTAVAVAAGDRLVAPLAANTRATFYSTATGSTGVTCALSQFTAQVLTNPTAPGTATESLTGQSFDSCTSNVTGVTSVKSLTVGNLAYAVSVGDAAGNPVAITPGTGGPIQATAVLNSWFGTLTCTYQLSGAFTGTADNATHGLVFANAHFTKSGGSGLCPGDGYFSAAYGPVGDSSRSGSPVVQVN